MSLSALRIERIFMVILVVLGCALLPPDGQATPTRSTVTAAPAPGGLDGRKGGRAAAPERSPAPIPASIPAGEWKLVMRPAARHLFRASVASTPPRLRAALDEVSGSTTVRVLHRTRCGEHSSCAMGRIVEVGGVRTGTYTVQLDVDHVDRTMASRFLMLHELAHVVDYHAVDDVDMDRFVEAFRQSPRWRSCFPHDGACVAMDEVFADQFAIHATGQARSMSAYRTPRLLDDATFEALLEGSYTPAG